MTKNAMRAFALRATLGVATCLPNCTSDVSATDAVASGQLAVPPRGGFEIVADAMQLHCGTLDCHGQAPRNMRFYGQFGMRLSSGDDPLGEPTRPAEYDATYVSVVGVEPEAMSRVAAHEASAASLTMVRKARGVEHHKGGQLQIVGDPLDRCMTSWLTGAIDHDTCDVVVQAPRP